MYWSHPQDLWCVSPQTKELCFSLESVQSLFSYSEQCSDMCAKMLDISPTHSDLHQETQKLFGTKSILVCLYLLFKTHYCLVSD